MSFKLTKAVSPNRVFIAKWSELTDRFDPEMVRYRRRIRAFRFPQHSIRSLLSESAQYGAGERGLDRLNKEAPRYIRITDIDEFGVLSLDLGATAAVAEAQYFLNDGDLLLARSGNTVGKAYIHKTSLVPDPCFFAGYLIRFRFNRNLVSPDYVFAYTQLPVFKDWVNAVQRRAGQPNINAEEYSQLKISLPPPQIQREIIERLGEANDAKRSAEAQARQLLASIDDLLLSELGIQLPPAPPATLKNRVFTRPFSELTGRRFDPSSHSRNLNLTGGKFPAFPVTKVARLNPRTDFSHLETALISFVPMEAVSDDLGEADCSATRPADAAKSYTPFQEGDVISAKITPCMENGKTAVLRNLVGGYGYGSTEYHVFRPDPTRLNAEYLQALLRLQTLRSHARLFFTGSAGHQRVSEEFFYRLQIPVPPLKTQERIVEKIAAKRDEAKRLRAAAAAQLAAAKLKIEAMILGTTPV